MNTISLITQKNNNLYNDIINRYSITKENYLGYLSLVFKRNEVLSPQTNKITYVKNEHGKNERKIVVNNYFTNKLFIKNNMFFLNQIVYMNACSINRNSYSDYSSFEQICNWDKSSYFCFNSLIFNKCYEEIKHRELYQLQGEENNKTFYKERQKILQRISFEENSRRYFSEEIFKIKEEILRKHNIEEKIYRNSIDRIMRNMELTKELRVNDYEKFIEEKADIRENSKISTSNIKNIKISKSNIENSEMITGNIKDSKIITGRMTELEEQFFKYIVERVRWTNSEKTQRETETLNIVKYGTRKESTQERIYQRYFKNKYVRREQELKKWTIEEKIYRNSIDRIMRNMQLTKELRVNDYEKFIEKRVADIRENSKISISKISTNYINSKISTSNIKNSKISNSNIENSKMNTGNIKYSKIITGKMTELEEQFFKYIVERVRWTNSERIQRETETLNIVKYGTRKESTQERIYQRYIKNKYVRREQELKKWTIEEKIYRNSIDRIMRNMELTKELRVNDYEKFIEEKADIRENSKISISKISTNNINSNISTSNIKNSKISNSNIENSKIITDNMKDSKIITGKMTELEEQFFKHIAQRVRWTNSKKIQRETETLNIVKYGTRKESMQERIYQRYFKNKYVTREQELKKWTIEERIYRNSIDRIMRNMELTKELRVNEYEKFIEERVADIRENSKISISNIKNSKISSSNIENSQMITGNIKNNKVSYSNIRKIKMITSKLTELEEQFLKYIAEKVRWTNSKKIQGEAETLNIMKYGTRKESAEERIYERYFKNKYERREQELKNWTIEERIYRNSINRIMRNMEVTKALRVNEYEKFIEERVADIRENSKIRSNIKNSKISNSNIENRKMITSNINSNINSNKISYNNIRNSKMITRKLMELEEKFLKYIAEKVRWTNSKKIQEETETFTIVKCGTRKENVEDRVYWLYFKNKYERREQELKNWTIEERIYRNSINRIMGNMEVTKDLRVNEYEKFIEERVADISEISNSKINTSNIKNSNIITSKMTELEEQFLKYIAKKVRWTNSGEIQRETETLNILKYGTRKEGTEERIYQIYFKNKYDRWEQELKSWTIEESIYRNSVDRIMKNIDSAVYTNMFSQPVKKYKIAKISTKNLNNQTIEKKIYNKTLKQLFNNIKITRNIDGEISEGNIIEEALKIYKHLKGDKIINQDFIENRNRSERNERLLQTIFVEHKETNFYKNIIARSIVEELVQKFSLESKLNIENQIFKKIIQRVGIRDTGEITSDMITPKTLFALNSASEKSEGIFQLLLKKILKNKSIINFTKISEMGKFQNETEHNLYKHFKADNKINIFSDTLKRNFLSEGIEKHPTVENKIKTEVFLKNKTEVTKSAKLSIQKKVENEILYTTNDKLIKNVKYRKINKGNIDNAEIIKCLKAGKEIQSTIDQVLNEELINSTVMEFKKQIAHKKTEVTTENNKSSNDYEEIVKRLKNEKARLTSSQIDDLVEEIYWKLEKRIRFERQRAGL